MVNVDAAAVVPLESCAWAGLKLQVGAVASVDAPSDATAQVKFTIPENPSTDWS